MNANKRSAVIVSASSDIGTAVCRHWSSLGWDVVGTFRRRTEQVEELESAGIRLVYCDLGVKDSVAAACAQLQTFSPQWDALVLCPGAQEPVGPFSECDFDEWEESVLVNFTRQLSIVHKLLPFRARKSSPQPCVLFFAGGGTNNAPLNYSAYIISKIALIKMCELLDAENPDARFAIVGPGWVKTKIHNATLEAGDRAGDNYQTAVHKLKSDECTPMQRVLDCLDWLVDAPRGVMSGRNFSVVYDQWGNEKLEKLLRQEPHMYKLRRHGSDLPDGRK